MPISEQYKKLSLCLDCINYEVEYNYAKEHMVEYCAIGEIMCNDCSKFEMCDDEKEAG